LFNYKTQQGDTWDHIALKVYGSEKQMTTLIEANPQHRNVVFFSANVILNTPNINTTATAPLPPWRR
jgi:phage tail protein X